MRASRLFPATLLLAFILFPAYAVAQSANKIEVVSESRSETAYRRQVTSMASCAFARDPQQAVEVILNSSEKPLLEFARSLAMESCLKAFEIAFSSELLRTSLAREAFLQDDLNVDLPENALKSHRYQHYDASSLNDPLEYYRFANCVYLSDAIGAKKLLGSYPSSSTESKAIAELSSSFAECGDKLAAPKLRMLMFTSALSHVAFLHKIGQPFEITEASK